MGIITESRNLRFCAKNEDSSTPFAPASPERAPLGMTMRLIQRSLSIEPAPEFVKWVPFKVPPKIRKKNGEGKRLPKISRKKFEEQRFKTNACIN
jgi:hypothetical protein